MSPKDPYTRENIIAAINLVGAGMTAAEKRAVLKAMTADVGRLAAEAKEFGVTSGPTERERIEMPSGTGGPQGRRCRYGAGS